MNTLLNDQAQAATPGIPQCPISGNDYYEVLSDGTMKVIFSGEGYWKAWGINPNTVKYPNKFTHPETSYNMPFYNSINNTASNNPDIDHKLFLFYMAVAETDNSLGYSKAWPIKCPVPLGSEVSGKKYLYQGELYNELEYIKGKWLYQGRLHDANGVQVPDQVVTNIEECTVVNASIDVDNLIPVMAATKLDNTTDYVVKTTEEVIGDLHLEESDIEPIQEPIDCPVVVSEAINDTPLPALCGTSPLPMLCASALPKPTTVLPSLPYFMDQAALSLKSNALNFQVVEPLSTSFLVAVDTQIQAAPFDILTGLPL